MAGHDGHADVLVYDSYKARSPRTDTVVSGRVDICTGRSTVGT